MRSIALTSCILLLLGTVARAQDMALKELLIDGATWTQVAEGFRFTEGPAADAAGNVFFTDIPNNRIHQIATSGEVTLFAEDTGGANGLMFGPDGKLYACANGRKQIEAYTPDGKKEVVVTELGSNDLTITADGSLYVSEPPTGKVWYINSKREKRVVAEGLKPNGVILWRDGGTLVVTDRELPHLWAYRVEADGSLSRPEKYYGPLQIASSGGTPGSDGMTIDEKGRLFLASRLGLQVFDPTGRPCGTIAKPQPSALSNVCFGGEKHDTLFVTAGDKVFSRKVNSSGVRWK